MNRKSQISLEQQLLSPEQEHRWLEGPGTRPQVRWGVQEKVSLQKGGPAEDLDSE